MIFAGGGRKVVYGTDDGVYISDLRELNREPVKVLSLLEVSQVDVLEEYQLLIVLSGTPPLPPSPPISSSLTHIHISRTTSDNLPTRRTRPTRPNGRSKTSKKNILTYIILQSWFLFG